MSAATQTEPGVLMGNLAIQPAKPLLRQIGEWMGLTDEPGEELAALPPWTTEHADAFEQAIADACERVEP